MSAVKCSCKNGNCFSTYTKRSVVSVLSASSVVLLTLLSESFGVVGSIE